MDSIHDLGGRQGYGPIDVNESEVPFKHEWEGRMWGIARCTDSPDWTIDWWRHIREAIDPADYLTRPYFDSWAQTQIAGYLDSGVFTLAEIIAGELDTVVAERPAPITFEEAIKEERTSATSYEKPINTKAQFNVGQVIVTSLHASSHHTRLPGYARGKTGTVTAYHGAHVFPDKSAQGLDEAGHLYTVAFEAGELWPDTEHPTDVIHLDLWEQYFDAG